MVTHVFGTETPGFRYSHTLGIANNLRGPGFRHPMDMALSGDGSIYVVNRSYEEAAVALQAVRINVVNLDEDFGAEFGKYGSGNGEFILPTSIALDRQDNVYVADEWLNRISIFDKKGNFLDKWGVSGSKKGELNRPTGIVFDQEENLYLVDSFNNRIQLFRKDGKALDTFGKEGRGDGEFSYPWGIGLDTQGNVYVADWRNDRIQKFTADGKFIDKFGSSGDLPGEFNRPSSVAVDKDGDVYVADWGNHRAQVFSPQFKYITSLLGDATLSKWGWKKIEGNAEVIRAFARVRDMTSFQRFRYPSAVEVDDQGTVLVADCSFHRIQVYKKQWQPVSIPA